MLNKKNENLYLTQPEKGLQLFANILSLPPQKNNDQIELQSALQDIHFLINNKFIELTQKNSHPNGAEFIKRLFSIEKSLNKLVITPDLADQVVIGIAGAAGSGKSHFLNNITNSTFSPENIEKTASSLFFVKHSHKKSIHLTNKLNHTIEIDESALQAITTGFNEKFTNEFSKNLCFFNAFEHIELHTPDVPWKNLLFIDLPGYNKPIYQKESPNDLKEIDHLLWIINIDNTKNIAADIKYLSESGYTRKVSFVLSINRNRIKKSEITSAKKELNKFSKKLGILIENIFVFYSGSTKSTQDYNNKDSLFKKLLDSFFSPFKKEYKLEQENVEINSFLSKLDKEEKVTYYNLEIESIIDDYIYYNKKISNKSRKNLASLNRALILKEGALGENAAVLKKMINEQRNAQNTAINLIKELEKIKAELIFNTNQIAPNFCKKALTAEQKLSKAEILYTTGMHEAAFDLFNSISNDNNIVQYYLGMCYKLGNGISENSKKAFHHLKSAAEDNHIKAQYELGNCYEEACGVAADLNQAFIWYQKSASQAEPDAQNKLGEFYLNGNGVTQNYELAFEWFSKAVKHKQPSASAQKNMGICYYYGHGIKKNYKKAYAWFNKAAKQGDINAQTRLGLLYYNGEGVKQNYAKSYECFSKAAEQGSHEAQTMLADCYLFGKGTEKNNKLAIELYKKAANQGLARAQCELGAFYCFGLGVIEEKDKNSELGIKWLRKAVEQNHADAQLFLAHCYFNGVGVVENLSEAFSWYYKSAEQGQEGAQLYLGVCYENGYGVNKNASESFKWYCKSAEQGNSDAQLELGLCYKNGFGVNENILEAVKWFRKAAEQQNADAQKIIGDFYLDGRGGLAVNKSEAIKWYRKAAEQGNKDAMELLKKYTK